MEEHLFARGPRRVWRHFVDLSRIPRPPGGEGRVRDHLVNLAWRASWDTAADRAGNVVLRVPGRGSLAGAEPLILQSHMDMVCEKEPGTAHDFDRDPLRLAIEGEWLKAEGTTLGADNGVGMALALAAGEAELGDRPPLELLFTVDEESGLTGAMKLDASILRGRRLVNLDSETEGTFIVSCAGGRAVTVLFPRSAGSTAPPGPAVRCRFGGLRGGHSGLDIGAGRSNAIVCAASILGALRRRAEGLCLLSLDGGTQFNVIPREAEFLVAGTDREDVRQAAAEVANGIRPREPGVRFSVSAEDWAGAGALPWGMVDLVDSLPNGVIAMDDVVEALVRTSSNLGVVKTDEAGGRLLVKVRSAEDSDRDAVCERILALARDHGGDGETAPGYPGWAPSSASELVRGLGEAYLDLFGRPAAVRGIHAGLEAGVIGAMIGTGELVSLGPTIENAHSPAERLLIGSVEPVLRLLETFLASPRWHGKG